MSRTLNEASEGYILWKIRTALEDKKKFRYIIDAKSFEMKSLFFEFDIVTIGCLYINWYPGLEFYF